ncbi:MAG: aldo/keto reductase [Candidatus Azobacteroides sp.]|nr:aldo/keto reductase [Candidatus Azobacteroides sp.]
MTINRRKFLRISAAAGAGALLFPSTQLSAASKAVQDKKQDAAKIPTRILGRTGVELPVLSMGVMRADNPGVVRAAYNSGIFHFDTAHSYQKGKNEELLGNFFKDKNRDSFFISTKGTLNFLHSDTFEKDYADLLETSLQRLQMDHVDLFYIHAVKNTEEITDERMINVLKKFKEDGKTRFIGFSSHDNKPELIDAAVEAGIYDVILLSYNFKLNNLPEIEAAIERGAKAGIGFIAMKTMSGGVEDADGKKKINAQACLKWVWKNKNITTAIPGFSNYDELDECLAAAQDLSLTQEEEEYLAELYNREMLYCQNCKKCVEQCVEHLPIPDIMRAYMYTHGYKYPSLSKETLAGLNLSQPVCSSCEICKVSCPFKFNVARKIAAITPVLQVPDEFLV